MHVLIIIGEVIGGLFGIAVLMLCSFYVVSRAAMPGCGQTDYGPFHLVDEHFEGSAP